MDTWLELARGPLLRFSFLVMVLGLLRNLVLILWGMADTYRRCDDRAVPWSQVIRRTLGWLVPLTHLRQRGLYSLLSIVFHVGVIVLPVLLLAHIQLLEASIGVSWPALPMSVADFLTLLTMATLLGLLLSRLGSRTARGLSRPQDYLIPLLLMLPFVSGYLAVHQHLNPFAYSPTLLVHMLSAELCFLAVPFSKLSHMALMALAQAPSELGWRFPADYPEAVARQIGSEGQAI